MTLALTALTAGALLIRVHWLGAPSFGWDEGFSSLMAAEPSVARWREDAHPPLYYALLAAWRLVSDRDDWLRLLSAVLGAATVPVVYGLGARLFSRRAGLWAAAILAVTFFHVKYSQEARMYTLVALLVAGALWGLVAGARDGSARGWAAYALCAGLLLWSHGVGPLYVLSLALLFPLLSTRPADVRRWVPWAGSHLAALLIFAPWLLTSLRRTRQVVAGFWVPPSSPEPPFLSTLYNSTVSPIPPLSAILRNQFGLETGSILGRWVWFVPLLGMLVWALIAAERERRWAINTLVAAYALPIALLTTVSLMVQPVLIPRVLVPAVVPVALLLGSLGDSRWRVTRRVCLPALAGLLLLGTLYHHRGATKEPWRDVSGYLQGAVQPGDALVFGTTFMPWEARTGPHLIDRYDPGRRLERIPRLVLSEMRLSCGPTPEPCLAAAVRAASPSGTLWIIHSHSLRNDRLAVWLRDCLDRTDTREWEGIVLERASRRPPGPDAGPGAAAACR